MPLTVSKSKKAPPSRTGLGPGSCGAANQPRLRTECRCLMGHVCDDGHSPGSRKPVDSGSSAFLTLSYSATFRARVRQCQLDLSTTRSQSYKADREHVREQNEVLNQLIANQKARAKAAAKERRQQEVSSARDVKNATAFLSFRYGKPIEERRSVGSHWSLAELVQVPPASPNQQSKAPSGPSANEPTPHVGLRSKLPPSPADSITGHQTANLFPPKYPKSLVAQGIHEEMDDRHGIRIDDGGVGDQIRSVIYDLENLQSRVQAFRSGDEQGLNSQVNQIAQSLQKLHDRASDPNNPLHEVRIAQEIVDYVDDGRNPDIFTREFVEIVQRGNAVMNGKQKAFREFSKIYAKALKENFEGLDDEVDLVMGNAGMVERDGKFVEGKPQNGNAV